MASDPGARVHVPERTVEDLLHFLLDSPPEVGELRAAALKAEHMIRVTRSQAFLLSRAGSAAAREAEAYASDQYIAAVDRHVSAVQALEAMLAKRRAAETWIEAWRTASATQRAARI
jgi:hypothetical protein